MRKRSPFAIGSVLAAVLIAGCGGGSRPVPGSSSPAQPSATATATATATAATPVPAATSATSATALPASATAAATPATSGTPVHVTNCPVPAGDYAGTPYAPRAAPATFSLPASVPLPGNAQIFGTAFLPGSASYLLGPGNATCQAALASADGGESMTASPGVTMIIRPGGIGPSTDLACPYIPAVRAADEAFRQGQAFCSHPAGDVIAQIPTRTTSLYAAVVLVPATVKDPGIRGSGNGADPTVALYTAQAGSGFANGQTIACTLAPAQGGMCAASLRFFLATQAQISTRIGAANLTQMQDALSSFLTAHHIG
ncbi:MAG: hypothetical protein WAL72_16515 [Streptosporangiaceae bacterium]